MEVRIHLIWRFISILGAIIGILASIDFLFISKTYNLKTITFLILSIVFIPGFLFVLPTVRAQYNEKEVMVSWKIFIPFIYKYTVKLHIPYAKIDHVISLFPPWFPYHAFYVLGNNNSLFIGIFYTKKKETLKYIARKRYNPNLS